MSATEPVQAQPRSHRNTKPRVPSSRHAPKPSADLGREIVPEDSASNAPSVAPSRTNTSSRSRVNGVQRSSYEKRIERTRTTATTQRIRTVSPVKSVDEDIAIPLTNGTASHEDDAKQENKPAPSWNPEACLVAHTSAPLARRVCNPPSSASLPRSLEPIPLKQRSTSAQEGAIMEDLLFAFMGYEGQYIRFDEDYDPTMDKSRLKGPTYRILSGLDPSLRDLATTVLKMATHYSAVEFSIEILSRDEFGMINHALCAAIRKLLREYITLLAQLEHQVLTNPAFTLHVLHLQILPTMHTMLQLYTVAMELLRRNRLLEEEAHDDAEDFEDDDDKILELLRETGELVIGSKKLCLGGNTLRLLTERLSLMSGDPAARDLFEGLLRNASYPYVTMLNDWLHRGVIKDRYAEFLIKEQRNIRRDHLDRDFTDQYWDKRYTIREDDVPPQLDAVKDKVLLAGKYLNVVRECGGVGINPIVHDVPKSFEDPRFLDNINDAYTHANSSLLNLLLTTHGLPERLRSVKHYFFLDRSEFFSSFLAQSRDELQKHWKLVNVTKLQSLLDLALRQPGSIAAQDPFKEDVKVQMNDQTLTSFLESIANVRGLQGEEEFDRRKRKTPAERAAQVAREQKASNEMTGFQALELSYSVPFPVSLVISSKTMVRYQIFFRYLVSIRHVEDTLITSWEDHSKVISWTNRSGNKRLENWKRRAWALRGRMLNFVQQYMYYCTSEVIEPHWNTFMSRVNGSEKPGMTSLANAGQTRYKTVDELMLGHVDLLDTCLKECCLINTRLLKLVNKLVSLCEGFCRHTAGYTRTLFQADASLVGNRRALLALSAMSATFPPAPASNRPRTPQATTAPAPSSTTRPGSSHTATPAPPADPDFSHIPERYRVHNPSAINSLENNVDTYEKHFNKHMATLLESLDYFAAIETVALSKLCAVLSWANEKNVEVPQEFGPS